jgi:AcrR family transcriptional regulator
MPRNRRPQPKAEKRAELIAAARTLFVRDGYDATPMNRIAQAAHVTPNTIYWYFRDKDDLLIGVLDELLGEALADYPNVAGRPLSDQLAWLVERLRPVSGLVSTVHTRIKTSPAIDDWHTRFHATFDDLFERQLPRPLPAKTRDGEMKIVAYTVEGLITHDVDPSASRRTCKALADRLHTTAASVSGAPGS